ncbi:MAG: phage antirepressor KilAC domain-containing protein [Geobacteraceae bacterium]|nr:phage antirepressor KilAC domain-containing protein [Geobacteraceae bacterium]
MENRELFPIGQHTIGGKVVRTVNARLLHEFLENKDKFATWIKDRIEQFNFSENQDFVTFSENSEKGRPRIEYDLTLNMAKELSMVERNEKGKQARQYFIECERLAKQAAIDPMQVLNDPFAMRGLLLNYTEKVIILESKVADLEPKAEALDRIANADGSLCITNAAKDLQVRPKVLFGHLSQNRWIYRRQGGTGWVAYQDKLQQGLLEHKVTVVTRGDGTEKVTEQVLITPKGLARLSREVGPPPLRLVSGGVQ